MINTCMQSFIKQRDDRHYGRTFMNEHFRYCTYPKTLDRVVLCCLNAQQLITSRPSGFGIGQSDCQLSTPQRAGETVRV